MRVSAEAPDGNEWSAATTSLQPEYNGCLGLLLCCTQTLELHTHMLDYIADFFYFRVIF